MAVTVRDVAAYAGVSPRTVSNVINDFRYVSAETRARVEAAIEALDYRPNLLARSLRSGRTGLVALLVPEIGVPYFSELAHEIIERAHARSWTVLIDETGGRAARERELLALAAQARFVDGVLLSALGLRPEELSALDGVPPVVLLGEQTAPGLDHVGIDNVAAARSAVEHLLARGCRRVALVGRQGSPLPRTSRLRLQGYRSALRAAGLRYDDALVPKTGPFSRSEGERVTADLLALPEPPDGIFCCNDSLAQGALRALADARVRVPRDVRVVGFDDVEEARYSRPRLTSVAPDKAALAQSALDLLDARITGTATDPQQLTAGFRLVERESSARR